VENESQAKETINHILLQAKNPCICFSGGKKSLVLLHLIKSVSKKPLNVIFIDTTAHFDNTRNYVEKMRRFWGFYLISATPAVKIDNIAMDKDFCCNSLFISPLWQIIQKNGFDYVFIGSIRTENRIERLLDTTLKKKDCVFVSPIENFLTEDIWHYIHAYNLPYCSLYDIGYSRLDCKPCSVMDESRQNNILNPDDEDLIIEKLKKLGYL